jgi:hypothetical protein
VTYEAEALQSVERAYAIACPVSLDSNVRANALTAVLNNGRSRAEHMHCVAAAVSRANSGFVLPGSTTASDAALPDQTAVGAGIETATRGLGPTPGRTSSIASMPMAVIAPVARNIEA